MLLVPNLISCVEKQFPLKNLSLVYLAAGGVDNWTKSLFCLRRMTPSSLQGLRIDESNTSFLLLNLGPKRNHFWVQIKKYQDNELTHDLDLQTNKDIIQISISTNESSWLVSTDQSQAQIFKNCLYLNQRHITLSQVSS